MTFLTISTKAVGAHHSHGPAKSSANILPPIPTPASRCHYCRAGLEDHHSFKVMLSRWKASKLAQVRKRLPLRRSWRWAEPDHWGGAYIAEPKKLRKTWWLVIGAMPPSIRVSRWDLYLSLHLLRYIKINQSPRFVGYINEITIAWFS